MEERIGETKKERKEKLLKKLKGVGRNIAIAILVTLILTLFFSFLALALDTGNKMAVSTPHEGIVKKSEIVFIPSHYDDGKEIPSKVANYLEVYCESDNTTFRLTPDYLNEFIQEGDTVTVYTYKSSIYGLPSKVKRYRWEGELCE